MDSPAASAQTGSRSAFPDGAGAVVRAGSLGVSFRSKQGRVDALRGVELSIPRSSLFVLLGPNGAGKTTLMRCITGLVRPTSGAISVFGEAPVSGEASGSAPPRARLARMGVLIENPGAYGRLNTREYLAFFGSFYAVPDLDARIRHLCGELGLETGVKPVAKLSQGNRQKLQLARSLLHRPELLLWDEPTDHLDPASQRDVLAYLRGYLAESGATALVATHRLEQMEAVATHFGFLARGGLIAAGERDEVLDASADGADMDKEAAVAGGTGAKHRPGLRARLGFSRPVREQELAWLAAGGPGTEGFAARVAAADAIGNPEAARTPGSRQDAEAGRLWDVCAPDLRERMPELIKAVVGRDLPLASAELRRASLAEVYHRLLGTPDPSQASEPSDPLEKRT